MVSINKNQTKPTDEKFISKNLMENHSFELHWFWRITTKPYFFTIYYMILAFLIAVIMVLTGTDSDSPGLLGSFLGAILFMFVGLSYLLPLPIMKTIFEHPDFPYFYSLVLPIISILGITLHHFKTKKKIILKWLVITLFLIITLSFVGCVGMILSGT